MDKIGNLIKVRLNQHKLGESAQASNIIHKANVYLGKLLNCSTQDVKAYRLSNGILSVRVDNAVWGQEVWGVSSKLLKELQKEYGKNLIKKILTSSFAE